MNKYCISDLTKYDSKEVFQMGNQPKGKLGELWVKADTYWGVNPFGNPIYAYEGASETIVSEVLRCSNVPSFVSYNVCGFNDAPRCIGCESKDMFLNESIKDYSVLPVRRFVVKLFGKNYSKELLKLSKIDRIKTIVDFVVEQTGLVDFGKYLTMVLELDEFTVNDDRHFNNICVLQHRYSGQYEYCPVFDNGGAYMSCTDSFVGYGTDMATPKSIEKIKSKPFITKFNEQVKICEDLYGPQLKVSDNVNIFVYRKLEELKDVYPEYVIKRIRGIFNNRCRVLNKYIGDVDNFLIFKNSEKNIFNQKELIKEKIKNRDDFVR